MSTLVSRSVQNPLIDFRTLYQPMKSELLGAIATVLDSMQLFQGPQQRKFEGEFIHVCGYREAIDVSNDTDALELVLCPEGARLSDGVITRPNTAIAAEAISAVGARLGARRVSARGVSARGDITGSSLDCSKNLGAYSEAGALTTDDSALAACARTATTAHVCAIATT